MFRATVLFFCSIFLALTSYSTNALTAEQKAKIHEHFESIGMACIKDNVISEDDINNLRTRKVPTGPNAPCFLACIMKEIGLLDEEGMLQKENALEKAKSIFEDPDELKLMEDYLTSCININSEPVEDGAKGCDRAMLAFKCITEKASQFGFEV